MTRRIITALVVVLSCAVLDARNAPSAHADPNAHFSDIGVAVSGGVATYYLCIAASVQPLFAGVTVSSSNGGTQYSIIGVFNGLSCGPGTYAVLASSSSLPAGATYSFLAATGGMSDQTVLPPALPNSGFVSQMGQNVDTIAQDCPTLNFTVGPDGPGAPQDCHGTGEAGSFSNIGNMPPPTSTPPPPPPTSTPPPPPPTNTPAPPPTNTPPAPPTNPPPPPAPSATPPAPTSTAQSSATPAGTVAGNAAPPQAPQPTAPGGSGASGPVLAPGADSGGLSIVVVPPASARPPALRLRISAVESMVRPGDAALFWVSYVKNALVQATMLVNGTPAGAVTGVTDAHGRLLLTLWVPKATVLRNGHATLRLVAQAAIGTWRHAATIVPTISTRSRVQNVAITAAPRALLRALVSLPGRAPQSIYGTADSRGRFQLRFTPAAGAPLHGRVGQIVVSSLQATAHATSSAGLVVSDLVVSLQPGLFARCVQRPTISVAYRPNALIKVVASLTDGRRMPFSARTDATGHATIALNISYANAASTSSIKATVADAAPGAARTEAATLQVAVPQECQAPAIITIGG